MTSEDKARTRARLAPIAGIAAGVGSLTWLPGAALGATVGILAVGAAMVLPRGSQAPKSAVAVVPAVAIVPKPEAPRAELVAPVDPPPVETQAAPTASVRAEPSSPPRTPARAVEAPPGSAVPARAFSSNRASCTSGSTFTARAALGASPAEALALTNAHAARFPNAKLAMERELLAIDALRRLGRAAEARARGEALAARDRGGLYKERLRKLLDDAH
jgi:hypothetical protein